MRQIKFRVFDTFENKMIYDDVASYISFNDDGVVNNRNIFGVTHVMQFTGLHDKNGKEIYEGDIVKYMGVFGKIDYFKDGFWINCSTKGAYREIRDNHKHIEIIGNVHENKDLLNT